MDNNFLTCWELEKMIKTDPALIEGSVEIVSWKLCDLRLKDDLCFPWVLLIPRTKVLVTEVAELSELDQQQLMKEIARLSRFMKAYFKADKMNVATLGNMVPQLHVHVIARFEGDATWPYPIWQRDMQNQSYPTEKLVALVRDLRENLA